MTGTLAKYFAVCGMAAMALAGCSESRQDVKNAPVAAPSAQPAVPQGMSLYDIQGPPNPLWDRTPIDSAKMLTLTYTMRVRMAGHAEPQTVEVKTLGYCETVENESDYAEQCKKIVGAKLAWHARESLEMDSPFDLHVAAASASVRPYALFDKAAMIRALGGRYEMDLYTVLSLKPR
jgi:hypothetical protein